MKLTAESTVINDNKLNTNIDNAQNVANEAKAVADTAQGTAETALDKANGSVVTDTLHYLATSQSSGVTTSTAGWTTTVQAMTATNKYLWTYHTYTKANGASVDTTPVITGTYGEKGDQGDTGATGTGVSSVQPEYYLSTSATSLAGGSWSTTLTYVSGKYIWTRDKVTYSDSTSNYSTAIYNGALTSACANAQSALQIANDTAQYFWFTSSGSDTGAHISEKTQAQFVANPSGGNLLARSNGIAVRDGLTELATFGTAMQIGEATKSHVYVDYHSMQLIDKEGTAYLHVSDLRNEQGIASIEDNFTGDGSTTRFDLSATPIVSSMVVKVNGSTTTAYTTEYEHITLNTAPASGVPIVVTYNTSSSRAKVYTLGTRQSGNVGVQSFSAGEENLASGAGSVALGNHATATGYQSFAQGAYAKATAPRGCAMGWFTEANGSGSFAEGLYSRANDDGAHAENYYAKANGKYTHAGGYFSEANNEGAFSHGHHTKASGEYSHAEGYYTEANGNEQFVIGKYNVADTTSLFIIGKGTSSSAKANAFAVSNTGQVFVNGTSVHSSDRRLKEHIAYLDGEAIDFIDGLKPAHYIKDGEHHVGFYAQDVEEADKWGCMVGEMNGYKTLGYMELIAPLVAYVQRLEKRIDELERNKK